MNLQYINFFSLALLLLGIYGISSSARFLSVIISVQIIIVSSVINFFSFSLFLYNLSSWDKTFIFFALAALYLFSFLLVFYNYSKQSGLYEIDVLGDLRLFKLSKSDWWGEDKD